MLETTLFYLISGCAIVSAIGVIGSRSSAYSVLWLVMAMSMVAGLFVLLKAFLAATILILVYAGAILVLFLFVVMLIDFRKFTEGWERGQFSLVLALFLGSFFFGLSFVVIRSIHLPTSETVHGTAKAIGLLLFDKYLLPFELTSFLIIAAVISVVVLAKKESDLQ